VSLTQGGARNIVAREVSIRQGGAGTVIAGRVDFEPRSGAFIVVARDVHGSVKPVLDWRGALVLGGVLAVCLSLLARRRKG